MKKIIFPAIQAVLLVSILVISVVSLKRDHLYVEQSKSEWENEGFMEETYIQDNIITGALCNGRPVNIDGLRLEIPQLVCYYSAQSCASCINYAKKALLEVFPEAGEDSTVLYMTSFFPKEYRRQEKYVVDLGRKKLGLPIDETDRVYYFVIQDNKIEHIFIPERKYGQYTKTYLKQIRKRYYGTKD